MCCQKEYKKKIQLDAINDCYQLEIFLIMLSNMFKKTINIVRRPYLHGYILVVNPRKEVAWCR
jgi:hypothetical protein